jgi:hypothetical protein
MVFMVPGSNGLRRADGMFVKDPEVVRLIETRILHEAAASEPFVLRLPTPAELRAYRAMIAWKITQPVLVLETTNHTYLLHFSEDYVFFIEDIGPLGLQDLPGLGHRSAEPIRPGLDWDIRPGRRAGARCARTCPTRGKPPRRFGESCSRQRVLVVLFGEIA